MYSLNKQYIAMMSESYIDQLACRNTLLKIKTTSPFLNKSTISHTRQHSAQSIVNKRKPQEIHANPLKGRDSDFQKAQKLLELSGKIQADQNDNSTDDRLIKLLACIYDLLNLEQIQGAQLSLQLVTEVWQLMKKATSMLAVICKQEEQASAALQANFMTEKEQTSQESEKPHLLKEPHAYQIVIKGPESDIEVQDPQESLTIPNKVIVIKQIWQQDINSSSESSYYSEEEEIAKLGLTLKLPEGDKLMNEFKTNMQDLNRQLSNLIHQHQLDKRKSL